MANDIYIKRLNVVDSTNRYIRDEADALWNVGGGNDMVAVVASHQTTGRGQRGNVWASEKGCNLLLSVLLRPGTSLEVSNQFLLSQTVAVAIHSAMKRHGIDTRVKWPNDIYVGNRKLAGILVELDYSGSFIEQAIVGIGLNVNQSKFPEMDRVPVSMKMLLGRELSVDDVLAEILDTFNNFYRKMRIDGEEIAVMYNELLLGLGEQRKFIDANGCFTAVLVEVESDGHLLLKCADGTQKRYAFKEVEMVL